MKEPDGPRNLAKYWQIFFDIQYFLLCSPFRIKVQNRNRHLPQKLTFVATSWNPQRLLCGAFTFLNLFQMLLFVRQQIPKNPHNPYEYFVLASEINTTLLKCTLVKLFWLRQSDILKILGFMVNKNLPCGMVRKSCLISHFLFFCWCAISPILTGTNWLVWIILEIVAGTFEWGSDGARRVFLFEDLTGRLVNQTVLEAILPGIGFASRLVTDLFYASLPIATLLPLVLLWPVVRSFIGRITTETEEEFLTWPQVKIEYEAIKEFSGLLNQTFGLPFTCFLLKIIVQYSTKFKGFLFLQVNNIINSVDLVYLIVNTSTTLITLVVASDICNQV